MMVEHSQAEAPAYNEVGIREAAQYAGCNEKTIRNYIKLRQVWYRMVTGPRGPQYLVRKEEIKSVFEAKSKPLVGVLVPIADFQPGNEDEGSDTLDTTSDSTVDDDLLAEGDDTLEILSTLEARLEDIHAGQQGMGLVIQSLLEELKQARQEMRMITESSSREKARLERQLNEVQQALAAANARPKGLWGFFRR